MVEFIREFASFKLFHIGIRMPDASWVISVHIAFTKYQKKCLPLLYLFHPFISECTLLYVYNSRHYLISSVILNISENIKWCSSNTNGDCSQMCSLQGKRRFIFKIVAKFFKKSFYLLNGRNLFSWFSSYNMTVPNGNGHQGFSCKHFVVCSP